MKKNATAIGEQYPKLIPSVKGCEWCETVWKKLYKGEPIEDIGESCKECGRCVDCCGDEGTCRHLLMKNNNNWPKI